MLDVSCRFTPPAFIKRRCHRWAFGCIVFWVVDLIASGVRLSGDRQCFGLAPRELFAVPVSKTIIRQHTHDTALISPHCGVFSGSREGSGGRSSCSSRAAIGISESRYVFSAFGGPAGRHDHTFMLCVIVSVCAQDLVRVFGRWCLA